MITTNQLRVRLARWLLPTVRADGEDLLIPESVESARLERLDDQSAFAVLRFAQSEQDISVVATPSLVRALGDDLLDVDDDAQGVPGEGIEIGQESGGNAASYGGP